LFERNRRRGRRVTMIKIKLNDRRSSMEKGKKKGGEGCGE